MGGSGRQSAFSKDTGRALITDRIQIESNGSSILRAGSASARLTTKRTPFVRSKMRLHSSTIIFEHEGLHRGVLKHRLGHSGINFIGESLKKLKICPRALLENPRRKLLLRNSGLRLNVVSRPARSPKLAQLLSPLLM